VFAAACSGALASGGVPEQQKVAIGRELDAFTVEADECFCRRTFEGDEWNRAARTILRVAMQKLARL